MQGTLKEIDVYSLLELLELRQQTGILLIETNSHPNCALNQGKLTAISWFVFLVNGKIAYGVEQTSNSLLRLGDYLKYYQLEDSLNHLSGLTHEINHIPEYSYISLLLAKDILSPQQSHHLITKMVEETLFDILSVHHGSFIFEADSILTPPIMELEIKPLLRKTTRQLQQWKQFFPYLKSPDQRPLVTDKNSLRSALTENAYQFLAHWADGKTSLRQLSRFLNRDLITTSKAIYPCVQRGWVKLITDNAIPEQIVEQEQEENINTPIPQIVWLDDDLSMAKSWSETFKMNGYQLMAVAEPTQALSLIFQEKPAMVFFRSNNSELDSYQLCKLLRSCSCGHSLPIIILNDKDTFVDRLKAKLVKATDYLRLPLEPQELLILLEMYLGEEKELKYSN